MNIQQEVLEWLISHKVTNFSINEDLTVDVKGSVNIGAQDIIEIPIQFGIVTGSFTCGNNPLKSLLFSPEVIMKDFICANNELINLNESPLSVGGKFD